MRVSARDGRAGQDVLRRVGEASVLILISLADAPDDVAMSELYQRTAADPLFV